MAFVRVSGRPDARNEEELALTAFFEHHSSRSTLDRGET
jgi:hypothetical protein